MKLYSGLRLRSATEQKNRLRSATKQKFDYAQPPNKKIDYVQPPNKNSTTLSHEQKNRLRSATKQKMRSMKASHFLYFSNMTTYIRKSKIVNRISDFLSKQMDVKLHQYKSDVGDRLVLCWLSFLSIDQSNLANDQ